MEKWLLEIFSDNGKAVTKVLDIFLIVESPLLEILFISQEMKMFEKIHPCLSIVDNLKFRKTMISNH